MQVDFDTINAVSKKITLTIPVEDAEQAWQKYLRKAAKSIEVPGFRKGKAPLSMVERMYSNSLKDNFLKDSVSEYFDQATKEHEINFLLYPDVKEMKWEKGSEMIFEIEIEHEPDLEFKQLDNLEVPYHPITLESEIDTYLEELIENNARILDVDLAAENDMVEAELTISGSNEEIVETAYLYAGEEPPRRAIPELVGQKIGDTFSTEMDGASIKLVTQDSSLDLDNDTSYPVSIMVNAISRTQYPELNDDFARDLDYDDMASMREKIAEEMKLSNEHKNLDIENYAIVSKLFVDNQFDLPMKTIDFMANQEAKQHSIPEYQQYLQYQFRVQISQELVSLYILKNLRKVIELDITDEMIEEYITHESILGEHTVEVYKEMHRDEIGTEEFKNGVRNYFILRKLAETANFFVPDPESQQAEMPEAQSTEGQDDDAEVETPEKAQESSETDV
ncbi:MAG: trigger factor [Candidatus Cloacimonadota bacterium]|nr:trigger factor [Candidatus Cloacimonadota bacterium]